MLIQERALIRAWVLVRKGTVPLVPLVNDQQEPSPYEIYPQSSKMEEINDTIFSCLSQHSSLTTKKQLKIEECLTLSKAQYLRMKTIFCFLIEIQWPIQAIVEGEGEGRWVQGYRMRHQIRRLHCFFRWFFIFLGNFIFLKLMSTSSWRLIFLVFQQRGPKCI